jgi:hypothetical protein
MFQGKKPGFAGMHQALDGRIADSADAENRVCPSIQERSACVVIAPTHKLEIRLMQAEMVSYVEEGLKLSATLGQCDPLACQIHQAL